MALIWSDFVWTIRQWQRRRTTPASGSYTVSTQDSNLTANSSVASTWTLPTPSGSGQVLKVKNKGAADLTLSGTIFAYAAVTSLVLVTGDMVTLSDDGTHWSVGD